MFLTRDGGPAKDLPSLSIADYTSIDAFGQLYGGCNWKLIEFVDRM